MATEGIRPVSLGGLNTTASALTIPEGESPLMENVDVDISGRIQKRKGTTLLYQRSGEATGVTSASLTTGLGYNFLVQKEGADIGIYRVDNGVATRVINKANVFSASAIPNKAGVVVTTEDQPRVLFLTGTNAPVQVTAVEQSQRIESSGTTLNVPDAERFAGVGISGANSVLLFVNRVLTPASVSYNAGTQTLTFTLATSIGTLQARVIDVVFITWRWWAEAYRYFGSEFFQAITRFNQYETDQNVAVPIDLRTDLRIDSSTTNEPVYPIYARAKTTFGDTTYTRVARPQNSTEYTLGDGARYVYAADNNVVSAPNFFTFGATDATKRPLTAYAVRRREIRFQDGIGQIGNNIEVRVNGNLQQPNYGATATAYANYRLWAQNGTTLISAGSPTRAAFLSFEAATPIGVPFNSEIEVMNIQPRYIGSAAASPTGLDGTPVPAFGLGEWANYRLGIFPRTGAMFKNRLVLSGLASRPLSVLFSSVFDTNAIGKPFSHFMVNDKYTGDADAFELQVSAGAGEFVTAMIEWQDSLFVLTKQTVVRFSAVVGQPFGQTSANQQFVSSTGALNAHSVVKTDNFALYLSDRGVYDLTAGDNEQYTTRELSERVRDRFEILTSARYHELPWMAYDQVTKKLFVALPESPDDITTRKLLVWNAQMDAWTEYTTFGGFNTYHGVSFQDRTLGRRMTVALAGRYGSNNRPSNFGLLAFEEARFYSDFVYQTTSSASVFFTEAYVVHTTVAGQRSYDTTYSETGQRTGFSLLPYLNVEDARVLYDGSYLPFTSFGAPETPNAWFKDNQRRIRLTFDPPAGVSLLIEPKLPPIVYTF